MVKLIKSGLRKDRAVMFIFLLIIILSTLLMHTGLMASDYSGLYDRQSEETGVTDYIVFSIGSGSEAEKWFESADHVQSFQRSDVVFMRSLDISSEKFAKERSVTNWMFEKTGDSNGYSELRFVERDDNVGGRRIYLNIYTAYSSGLRTGDRITIDSSLGEYDFTVAGIYQHLFMGSSYTYSSVMVEPDAFDELKAARDRLSMTGEDIAWNNMFTVRIKDGFDTGVCLKETKDALPSRYKTICDGYTAAHDAKSLYTAVVNILAGFMGAFAVVIMAICLIIIVFTINNNISRDVANIGALKAVGYTVGQIRTALTAEYLLLGFIGSVIGIGLSYALYPVFEYLCVRQITGIMWENRFFPEKSFGVLAGVLAVTVVTAFLSTIKIRSLHPATALRFGLQSNSFKKNHLPLAETKGGLNFLLAVKSALQNKAQNVIVFFIILSVAFVTMFSGVLYYNTQVDITSFQRMIQGDVSDGYFYVKDGSPEAVGDTIEQLKTVPGITDAYAMTVTFAYIGDTETDIVYVTEPSSLNFGLYDGVMYREENEAVLGMSLADEIGAGVGDEVEVSYGDKSMRFLVTGLQQSALNNRIYVRDSAAKKLGIPVKYYYIRARVENACNENVDEALQRGRELCGNVTSTENYYRFQHSSDNAPVYAVGLAVMILAVLNIATVLLVIRLLLKTIFVKREKEFGIKKAVGFTSTQLRYQLSLSLMPTTLIASIAGAVLGYFGINPLFALVLGGYGIKNSDLLIKAVLIVIPIAAMMLLVFLFSFVMSGRMKKLSAYKLIQE